MKTLLKYFLTFTSLFIISNSPSFPQTSIGIGADINSRYNWRGLDFGDSPSFQPTLSLTVGGFSIGARGECNFNSGSSPAYSGNDLFMTYIISMVTSGSFPLQLSGYSNIKNDPDKSYYIQAGYPSSVGEVSLSFFAGFTPQSSAWYGTTKANLINLGISAAKEMTITDKFRLPVHVSYILNPNSEKSFLIAGISL